MAKMVESVIVIKASKLIADNDDSDTPVLGDEHLDSLSEVVKELAGDGVLVEVYNGSDDK